ncbi:MAG: type II secretion system protein GspK [Lacipirellulaceae bacterium]
MLLVLVVIAVLALSSASYLKNMQNEHLAVRYHGLQARADAAAASGVAYATALLSRPAADLQVEGGIQDNTDLFQAIPLFESEDPEFQWSMTIVSPRIQNGLYSGLRYGLQNESAKLHVNSLLPNSRVGGTPGAGQADIGSMLGGQSSEDNSDEGADDAAADNQAAQRGNDQADPRQRLLAIPGMDVELADALLDWLDTDDIPREFGAEVDYYQQLDPAVTPRNGPITSLDELLSIRGFTRELLYGLDQNRNQQYDAGESPRGVMLELDNASGQLNLGLSAYLTVSSAENILSSDPSSGPRIDINTPALQQLHTALSTQLTAEEAKFVILYRQYGGQRQDARESRNQNQSANAKSNVELDFQKQASTPINSLLDLLGTTVTIATEKDNQQQNNSNQQDSRQSGNRGNQGRSGSSNGNNAETQTVESPWPDSPEGYRQLLRLYDLATTSPSPVFAGRININEASQPVLMTIPGMSYALADQILLQREPEIDLTTSDQRSILWPLLQGFVTRDQLQTMEKYITTRGSVYSGQAVGFRQSAVTSNQSRSSEPATQIDVISRRQFWIDTSSGTSRVIDWVDLTSLGRGYSIETLSPDGIVQ